MKNILSAVLIALLVSVLMPFAKTKSNLQSLTFIRSPRSQQSIAINNPATIICRQTLSVPSSILISKLSVIVCVCLCLYRLSVIIAHLSVYVLLLLFAHQEIYNIFTFLCYLFRLLPAFSSYLSFGHLSAPLLSSPHFTLQFTISTLRFYF